MKFIFDQMLQSYEVGPFGGLPLHHKHQNAANFVTVIHAELLDGKDE